MTWEPLGYSMHGYKAKCDTCHKWKSYHLMCVNTHSIINREYKCTWCIKKEGNND